MRFSRINQDRSNATDIIKSGKQHYKSRIIVVNYNSTH